MRRQPTQGCSSLRTTDAEGRSAGGRPRKAPQAPPLCSWGNPSPPRSRGLFIFKKQILPNSLAPAEVRGEIEGDAAGVGDAKSVSSTSLWAAARVLAHCEASVRMIDRSSFPELNPLIPEEDAQPDFYYACAPGSLIQQARGWLAQGLQGGWSAGPAGATGWLE